MNFESRAIALNLSFEPSRGKTNNVVFEQVRQTELHKHRKKLDA